MHFSLLAVLLLWISSPGFASPASLEICNWATAPRVDPHQISPAEAFARLDRLRAESRARFADDLAKYPIESGMLFIRKDELETAGDKVGALQALLAIGRPSTDKYAMSRLAEYQQWDLVLAMMLEQNRPGLLWMLPDGRSRAAWLAAAAPRVPPELAAGGEPTEPAKVPKIAEGRALFADGKLGEALAWAEEGFARLKAHRSPYGAMHEHKLSFYRDLKLEVLLAFGRRAEALAFAWENGLLEYGERIASELGHSEREIAAALVARGFRERAAGIYKRLGEPALARELLLAEAERLRGMGRLQEAAWIYAEAGEPAIAERLLAEIEHVLRHGRIVAREKQNEYGDAEAIETIGATDPDIVTFENGMRALAKPDLVDRQSKYFQLSDPRREVGAYLLDRMIRFNKFPFSVERDDVYANGTKASLQYYVENAQLALHVARGPGETLGVGDVSSDLRVFDILARIRDRHAGNFLFTPGYREVGIDAERGFIYRPNQMGYLPVWEFLGLPSAAFYDGLLALSEDEVRREITPWLGESSVAGFLQVRDQVLRFFAPYRHRMR